MSSILLVQSDPAATTHFCEVLGTQASLAVSAAVHTLAQARLAIARRVPDLLIADLRLADGPIGNLLDELRPDRSHVIVLATSLRDPHLMHALRHGGDAYLIGGSPRASLLALVRKVLVGESEMGPEIARRMLGQFDAPPGRAAPLPPAEQHVLQLIGEGYLAEEIARSLNATPQQVGLLLRSVYRRLHLDLRLRQLPKAPTRVR